jgi:hypothetical protein
MPGQYLSLNRSHFTSFPIHELPIRLYKAELLTVSLNKLRNKSVAQDGDRWRAFAYAVTNLQVP